MPYVTLDLPPGAFRPGSVYQAKGRWYDMSLMRWHEGAMQPIGGWSELIAAASLGSDAVRGMLSWRINSGISRMMLGTFEKAYVYDGETAPMSPTVTDITPTAGFTAGTDGIHVWQFDSFGEDVVAVLPKLGSTGDGNIWLYDASSATSDMTLVDASAPTSCRGVVVTPERFVVALGAGADPRKVRWGDQESLTVWTSASTNQAGSFTLASNGRLLSGRRGRGETLLWTDTDLWAMRYIGGTLVYSFTQLGSQCGAISSRAMAIVDGKAIWMGRNGFFMYDGFVRPLPCEVGDYIFGRHPAGTDLVQPPNAGIDRSLATYVFAYPNTQFNEVTWHYPSQGEDGTNSENDRYVTYNYVTDKWYIGALARTDGVEDGGDSAFSRPVLAAPGGAVYQHETPAVSTSADWGSSTPYATSGPIELGEGDNVMMIREYIPDSKSLGQWRATLYTALYPTASETTHGPYTSANPTSVRATGRQVRIKVEAITNTLTHRFGVPRLEVVPCGRR